MSKQETKYNNFKPTRLYIKRHSLTGLLYFGKHTGKSVDRYEGSGSYWKNHINTHGKHLVVTDWISDWFNDPYDIEEFALFLSREHDIINKKNVNGKKVWANLIEEDGLWGGAKSNDLRKKDSELKKSQAYKEKIKTKCQHCDWVGGISMHARWHGDKCKLNKNRSQASIDHQLKLNKENSERQLDKQYKDSLIEICGICGFSGPKNIIRRDHNENCILNQDTKEIATKKRNERIIKAKAASSTDEYKKKIVRTCIYCGWSGPKCHVSRAHNENCKHNPNRTEESKRREEELKITRREARINNTIVEKCEYCDFEGHPSHVKQWHNEKCKSNK